VDEKRFRRDLYYRINVIHSWAFDRYRSHGLSQLYRAMKRHQSKVTSQKKLEGVGVQ